MLRKDNLISELGYSSYMMHRECMLGFLLVPQVVIWLEASPEVCLDRIYERDRSCESGITVQYLHALRDSYNTILRELEQKGSYIMRYDWNKIPPAEKIVNDLMHQKEVSRLLRFHEQYRQNPVYFPRPKDENNIYAVRDKEPLRVE
jgi:deoxyadenosine/deoxycytidine kinase